MKTIVVAQQKGGVGKTALALHLAWFLTERKNSKVLFIDLDTQGNATYSLSGVKQIVGMGSGNLFSTGLTVTYDFSDSPLVLLPAGSMLANIQNLSLQEAASAFLSNFNAIKEMGYFDYCVIDTPPSLGNALAAALMAADFVVCPIELETYSIQGIGQMALTINNIKKINKKLTFLGLLPSKVDMRNPRHIKHLAQIKRQYSDYLIPVSIGLRSSIADAVASSVPVWHIKRTVARKAAKEVNAVAEYIFTRMRG
ncbi:ParA family protein [Eikenella halliae]|uniref:ParA family protein n=1 Tax=Eikenella halliae TaxID=1795832 RepID=UPI00370D763A